MPSEKLIGAVQEEIDDVVAGARPRIEAIVAVLRKKHPEEKVDDVLVRFSLLAVVDACTLTLASCPYEFANVLARRASARGALGDLHGAKKDFLLCQRFHPFPKLLPVTSQGFGRSWLEGVDQEYEYKEPRI